MSTIYRRTMISLTAAALISGSVYAALFYAASVEGPSSDLELSWRANDVFLLAIVVPTLIAAQMLLTHCAMNASQARVAATVTVEVVGHLEARMTKVADTTAATGRSEILETMQQLAAETREELAEEIRAALSAARMHGVAEGMVLEAQSRVRDAGGANVSTIHGRRSE